MPTVTFKDGTSVFVQDTKPETLKKAELDYLANQRKNTVPLEEIASGVQRGIIGIAEGLTTIPTTVYDHLNDTDVTNTVIKHFEKAKPEVKTGLGVGAQYVTQFGLPGLGAAGIVSNFGRANKLKGALAAGVVDGAVNTDDVESLTDVFFDSESDQDRLARLRGSEAAYERLKERFVIAGEGAAITRFAPPIIKGGLEGVGRVAETAVSLPVIRDVARTVAQAAQWTKGKLVPAKIKDTINNSNRGIYNFLKRNFTKEGALPSQAVYQAQQAVADRTEGLLDQVDMAHSQIGQFFEDGVKRGKISTGQQESIARSINEFLFPLTKVEFELPNATASEQRKLAKQIQNKAMKNLLEFEELLDYKSYNFIDDAGDVFEGLRLPDILNGSRKLIDGLTEELQQLSKTNESGFSSLLLPEQLATALEENIGMYGSRAYKRYVDAAFDIDPTFQDNAIKAIQREFNGISKNEAYDAFQTLAQNSKNIDDFDELVNTEIYTNNISKGLLKGRTLNKLPEVRQALGQITGYLQSGSKNILAETKAQNYLTVKKLATIIGKNKAYQQILKENNKEGAMKFLLNPEAGGGGVNPNFGKARSEFASDSAFQKAKTNMQYIGGKENDAATGIAFTMPGPRGNPIPMKQFGEGTGALKGYYGRKDVVDAITGASSDVLNISDSVGKLFQKGLYAGADPTWWEYSKGVYGVFLGTKSAVQYGKTVASPGTQLRNITNTPMFSAANGNLGTTGRVTDAVQYSFAGLFDPATKTLLKEPIDEMTELGIILRGKGATGLAEVKDLSKSSFDILKSTKKIPGVRFAEKVYGMTDDAARVHNYIMEQGKLTRALNNSFKAGYKELTMPVTAGRNMSEFAEFIDGAGNINLKTANLTDEQLKRFINAESAEIAKNTVPNYGRVPNIIKNVVRMSPFGNFVSFPSEVIRNIVNITDRGLKEIASTNPEIQKIGARRLAGAFMVTAVAPKALEQLGSNLTGVSQEQIDAYRRQGTPWDKTATLVPISSDMNGYVDRFLNYSYLNPYDLLNRIPRAALMSYAEGTDNEEQTRTKVANATGEFLKEFGLMFAEPSIVTNALLEINSGRTATGREIFDPDDPAGVKTAKGFIHLIDTALPTVSPYGVQYQVGTNNPLDVSLKQKDTTQIVKSIIGGDPTGQELISSKGGPIDVKETMVQAFTGLKQVKPQMKKTIGFKAYEAKDEIAAITANFNDLLRSKTPVEAEQFIKGYIETNADRFESLRDLYRSIKDARILGVGERDILDALTQAKVSSPDLIMRNLFEPLELNIELADEAYLGSSERAPLPVPTKEIQSLEREMQYQPIEGQFDRPINRLNAAEVLREEERKKLLGTP